MKSQEVFIRFMAAKSTNRRNSNLIAIDYSNIAIMDSKRLIKVSEQLPTHHMSHYLIENLLYMCAHTLDFSCAIICPCYSLSIVCLLTNLCPILHSIEDLFPKLYMDYRIKDLF